MTNHPNRAGKFEIVFWGGAPVRYRRWHTTLKAAETAAREILADMEDRAARPAIIYGPGCGRDGITIA